MRHLLVGFLLVRTWSVGLLRAASLSDDDAGLMPGLGHTSKLQKDATRRRPRPGEVFTQRRGCTARVRILPAHDDPQMSPRPPDVPDAWANPGTRMALRRCASGKALLRIEHGAARLAHAISPGRCDWRMSGLIALRSLSQGMGQALAGAVQMPEASAATARCYRTGGSSSPERNARRVSNRARLASVRGMIV